MKVLGASGSPIENSNTDRIVKIVLEATGLDAEFIKLTDYVFAPCKACLGCRNSNECEVRDDGIVLAQKAKSADALVIGGFTPYSSLDSRTKAFMERLYPLRHNHGYLQGKPGVAVVTSAVPIKMQEMMPAIQMGVNAIKFFMVEEGMNYLGAVECLGNVPCVKCDNNKDCKMSGIKMIYGKDATPESVGINTFEDQYEVIDRAYKLGKEVAAALNKK